MMTVIRFQWHCLKVSYFDFMQGLQQNLLMLCRLMPPPLYLEFYNFDQLSLTTSYNMSLFFSASHLPDF